MLYATKSVAERQTQRCYVMDKSVCMGQNCILPFGWDNFVPAIMLWDKINSSMPRLIMRKPTYKRRARNRHLHHCGITIFSTFFLTANRLAHEDKIPDVPGTPGSGVTSTSSVLHSYAYPGTVYTVLSTQKDCRTPVQIPP